MPFLSNCVPLYHNVALEESGEALKVCRLPHFHELERATSAVGKLVLIVSARISHLFTCVNNLAFLPHSRLRRSFCHPIEFVPLFLVVSDTDFFMGENCADMDGFAWSSRRSAILQFNHFCNRSRNCFLAFKSTVNELDQVAQSCTSSTIEMPF